MKKKLWCIALCVMMLLTSVGCSNGANDDGGEYKDTLVYAIRTDVQYMDPQVQNDTTSESVVKALYNTLLKFEDDGSVVGDLAEDWSVSEDQLTWTFKLKEGVKFHNGKEMTAEDVKATFERAMFAEAGGLRTTEIIKMFTSVDVVDPYTVSITTDEPYGPMESLMCNMSLAIMDADYIEKYGAELGAEATVNV